MHLNRGMKVGVLFSGGKDSTFALHWAEAQGWELKCLITLASENPASYMFHTPNIHLVKEQAKCLDLPLIFKSTKGVKEEELKDLKSALEEAKKQHQIDTIIVGAVASDYQEERVQRVCAELGLRVFAPLWHKNQEQLVKEMIDANFDIRLIAVAADGLDESYLGRKYDQALLEDFKKKHQKYGLHIAGEGGEFESFVLDCPLFKERLEITKATKVMDSKHSGYLKIEEIKRVPKQ